MPEGEMGGLDNVLVWGLARERGILDDLLLQTTFQFGMTRRMMPFSVLVTRDICIVFYWLGAQEDLIRPECVKFKEPVDSGGDSTSLLTIQIQTQKKDLLLRY